jgi:hypothetical protein
MFAGSGCDLKDRAAGWKHIAQHGQDRFAIALRRGCMPGRIG